MAAHLVICNWKMYISFTQAVYWLEHHTKELSELITSENHQIVLCPSFDALVPLVHPLKNSNIQIGAQDCSAYSSGPYTGQVNAQSLKEIGCSYVLIGHSETRHYLKVSTEIVVLKLEQAFNNGLTPVVCIGETKDEYVSGQTVSVLEQQIKPVLIAYKNYDKQLVIAYEPIWSIGTNQLPDKPYLENVYEFITKQCYQLGIQRIPLLLYGGSVDETTIPHLTGIKKIQGFLIGRASTDSQKLKKIVELI